MKSKKPRKPAKKKFKAYKAERVLIDHKKITALVLEETTAIVIRGRLCRHEGSRTVPGCAKSTATFVTPDGIEIDVTVRYYEW